MPEYEYVCNNCGKELIEQRNDLWFIEPIISEPLPDMSSGGNLFLLLTFYLSFDIIIA